MSTTNCFVTEAQAREYARTRGKIFTTILYSPHEGNPVEGDNRKDYYVGGDPGMIRHWEKLLFEGKGKDA